MEGHNVLGYGFLEKVCGNVLKYELKMAGFQTAQQIPTPVHYKDRAVGEYFLDLLVGESILIELKSVKAVDREHAAQLLNYCNATNCAFGYTGELWAEWIGISPFRQIIRVHWCEFVAKYIPAIIQRS